RITAENREMACRIERKGALHDGSASDVREEVVAHARVGARMRREDERLPVKARQMACKAQRALDAAASRERWEVIGNHEQPFHSTALSPERARGVALARRLAAIDGLAARGPGRAFDRSLHCLRDGRDILQRQVLVAAELKYMRCPVEAVIVLDRWRARPDL